MLTAPVIDIPASPAPRLVTRAAPVVLSALVHVLALLAWVDFPHPEPQPEEKAMAVELVPPPGPQPKSEAKPEAKAEAPENLQIPQVQQGQLAPQSTPAAPPQAGPTAKAISIPSPEKPKPVTQNERDFVLSQVLRHWQPPQDLVHAERGEIRVPVTVRPDGHFADTFDSRRPWNPAEVFDGYSSLAPQSLERRTVDAFYRAIRQSQPLKLPDALKAKAPFKVLLAFRFKDVR